MQYCITVTGHFCLWHIDSHASVNTPKRTEWDLLVHSGKYEMDVWLIIEDRNFARHY